MKRLVFLLLMQFSFFWVISNPVNNYGIFQISGKVTDQDSKPLIGATVVLENSMLGVTTNTDGSFVLGKLKPGNYFLVVSYIGYETQRLSIELTSDKNFNIILKQSSLMCEEVVVSSTRANTRMPIAQSTMNKEQVQSNNTGCDVPYILELLPSVVATSESGAGIGNTALRIRGTDMTRINVTVNGIPLNDAESQGVYWVDLPDFASSVDNVQVQRGVGTSTNGAGAFGATVNFQTITLSPDAYAGVDILGGSYNTLKTTAKIGTGLVGNHYSFDGRFSQVHSDGYIERGGSDHKSMFASAAYHDEKSLIRFNVIYGEEHTAITWEGNPDYMMSVDRRFNPAGEYTNMFGVTSFYKDQKDNYWQTHYQLIASHSFTENLTVNATFHLTDGKGYYEEYKDDKGFGYYGLPNFIVGTDTMKYGDFIHRKWMSNAFYGSILSLTYRQSSLELTLGGAWNRYDGDHFGRVIWAEFYLGLPKDYEWYRNNGLKTDWNTFAKANWQVSDKFNLFADIQVRGVGYKLKGLDSDLFSLNQTHSWNFFNPKVGLNFSFDENNQVYASFAVANREPARSDLKDALKGANSFIPKPETLYDYELGYKYNQQMLAFNANFYYMIYKDQLVLTGELTDVGYAVMANVPNSYRTGVELSLGFKPFTWMKLEANTTISKNIIKDYTNYANLTDNTTDWNETGLTVAEYIGKTTISLSPSLVGAGKLTVTPVKDLDLTWTAKYVGKQYIDNTQNSNRMLDSYFVNNFSVRYNFNLKGTKSIYVQGVVNNVLNIEYSANAWVYRTLFQSGEPEYIEIGYYPQATRNFLVRLGVEF